MTARVSQLATLGLAAAALAACGGSSNARQPQPTPVGASIRPARCATHMGLSSDTTAHVGSGAGALAIDGQSVWVARSNAGTVTRLYGPRPLVLRPGGAPVSLAVGHGKLWMALRDRNLVAALNLRTMSAAPGARLSVPMSVVAGPYGIWALSLDTGALYKLDPQTGAPGNPVFAPVADPIAMVASGQELWVLGADNGGLSPVNAVLGRAVRIGFDDAGRSVSGLSASDRTLWVGEPGRHDLLRVRTGSVDVHEVPAPYGLAPSATAIGACGEWVADQAGRIALIDPASGAALSPALRVGRSIAALAASGDGVWVSDPVDGTVVRVTARPAS